MNRYLLILVSAAFLVGIAVPAVADDFAPAPWRGDPLTYVAEWEFIYPDLTDLPPDYQNWVGDGIHEFNVNCYVHTHPQFVYWEEDPTEPGDGRAYTDSVPGHLDFFLCNWFDDYQYKYIWVQITYGGMGVPFIYEVVAPNEETNTWTDPVFGIFLEGGAQGGYSVEFWYIPYNPDREYVNMEIPPYTWVDQVWIDTISTPYPFATENSTWGGVKNLYR